MDGEDVEQGHPHAAMSHSLTAAPLLKLAQPSSPTVSSREWRLGGK